MRKRRSYGQHGLPYWLTQRVARLILAGYSPYRIERDTGVSQDIIRGLARRIPDSGYRRCPTCGGMVVLPCVACRLRGVLLEQCGNQAGAIACIVNEAAE